jgi:hypothetical protein
MARNDGGFAGLRRGQRVLPEQQAEPRLPPDPTMTNNTIFIDDWFDLGIKVNFPVRVPDPNRPCRDQCKRKYQNSFHWHLKLRIKKHTLNASRIK